jgi:N-acetylneuraminate synthase
MLIGTGRIVNGGNPWIVAEIGSAHGGDPVKAEELIAAAAEAGADCAKFQFIIADEIVHPMSGSISLPGGSVPIHKKFRSLEQPLSFYAKLKEQCRKHGIAFLCSPFGTESASLLLQLGVDAVKIASPELNHIPLLKATRHLPQILSTGVSSLADIERALEICGEESALLHCITSYPAPAEEYNIAVIPLLQRLFGVPVGVSDHSTDPFLVPVLAAAHGAAIIEKHFTLDRRGDGLDDPIALIPREFRDMCLSTMEAASESFDETLRKLSQRFGEKTVRTVIGDGRKTLSRSEKQFYATTNRSIIAVREIKAGEKLSEKNVALLRSETNMRPGLPAPFWDIVLGKTVIRPLSDGDGLGWEHLILD